MAKKRSAMKRELIDTGNDKRHVKRNVRGQFKASNDVIRSLSADSPRQAKTTKAGFRDQGDRPTTRTANKR